MDIGKPVVWNEALATAMRTSPARSAATVSGERTSSTSVRRTSLPRSQATTASGAASEVHSGSSMEIASTGPTSAGVQTRRSSPSVAVR
jgi:hypothetical protein